MAFSQIMMWVMAAGALIGGLDRIFGNKLGLGKKFEEGFYAMGPLALGMTGMVCLSPVLANVIAPMIGPLFMKAGIDPAVFGAILPNDTGGYSLAMSMAVDKQAGEYAGLIVASMLGSTVTFSIPVGMAMIEKEDRQFFAKGLVIGMIAIPLGSVVGGFLAGYSIRLVLVNTVPVFFLSLFLSSGLRFFPEKMMKACLIFGKIITIIITIGLTAAAFEYMTGIILIPGMTPIEEVMTLIGKIAVVLLGTFPFLELITRVLRKPLFLLGQKTGIGTESANGLVFCLANCIPVFQLFREMSPRGKIINTAWMVCATAALGDHLGFTAGVQADVIFPVVVSKILGGVVSVILALLLTKEYGMDDK